MGDWVDDTRQEAEPTSGCPVRKVTCAQGEGGDGGVGGGVGVGGEDPLHDFMDYSSDEWWGFFFLLLPLGCGL